MNASDSDSHDVSDDGVLRRAATAIPLTLQGDETTITSYGTTSRPIGSADQQRNALLNRISAAMARVNKADGAQAVKLSGLLTILQNSVISINPDDPSAPLMLASVSTQADTCSRELDKLMGISTTEGDAFNLAFLHRQLTDEELLQLAINQHYLIMPLDERIAVLTVLHQESVLRHEVIEEFVTGVKETLKDFGTSISIADALDKEDMATARKVKKEAATEMAETAIEKEARLIEEGVITTDSELLAYRKKSLDTMQKRMDCIDEAAADLRQDRSPSGFRKAYDRFVGKPADHFMQRHPEVFSAPADRQTRKLVESINAFYQHLDPSASSQQLEQYFNEHIKIVTENASAAEKEALMQKEFTNQELSVMLMKRQKVSELLSGHTNSPQDFANVASMLGIKEEHLRKDVSTFRRKNHLVPVPESSVNRGVPDRK